MSLLFLPVPRPCRRRGIDVPAGRFRAAPSRTLPAALRRLIDRPLNRGAALAFASQVLVVGGLLLAYHFARALADGKTGVAFDHSSEVWRWERAVHLPNELSLQHWVVLHPSIARLADYYYMGVHFPFTAAVLIYLYLYRRSVYQPMRNVLVLVTAAGLVLAFIFPLAPPRMRTDLGFTDVAAVFGQSVYGRPGSGTANQFAAMPSLHVGWAVLVGLALVAAGRTRLRWFWLAHPAITVAVVVGTANHYWADGIVAAALLIVAGTPVVFLASRRRADRPDPLGAVTAADGSPAEPAGTRRSDLVPTPRDPNHPFGTDPSPGSGERLVHQ